MLKKAGHVAKGLGQKCGKRKVHAPIVDARQTHVFAKRNNLENSNYEEKAGTQPNSARTTTTLERAKIRKSTTTSAGRNSVDCADLRCLIAGLPEADLRGHITVFCTLKENRNALHIH